MADMTSAQMSASVDDSSTITQSTLHKIYKVYLALHTSPPAQSTTNLTV